ncbi:BNR-4 repeat-containing protein [Umezawaea sp. NPDC059074]|uniref:BNR-4 repeat-containing protein n=1 Tax=Umezawaea sp. NPDC059074 TaxID=3346716 RepID=UPI0036A1950E
MAVRPLFRRRLAALLAAVALSAATTSAPPIAAAAPVQAAATLDTVTNAYVYGCLRTNGAALYDATVGKTFVAYSSTNHDIYLKAYDHASNSWSAGVRVAALNLTHDNAYHDYPVLKQLPDGRLTVFRAQHTVSAHMYTAPTAHSISGTWTARQISTDRNGYLEPIFLGGTIYLFYSQNTDIAYPYRTYRLITSSDSGLTWSAPRTLIDSGRTADKYAEVYAFGVTQRDSRVYLTWSMHGGPKGHNGGGKNIYVAYFETADYTLRTVGGTSLGTSITGAELAQTSVVTTSPTDLPAGKDLPEENPVAWRLTDGSVVLGYGVGTSTSRKIVLARYAGGAWTSTTLDSTTSLFKDIVASGDSVEVVYATADQKRLVAKRWTPATGAVTTPFDVVIPYNNGADTVFYADFVENRNGISVIASTINQASRKTEHTGRWPVFAIKN